MKVLARSNGVVKELGASALLEIDQNDRKVLFDVVRPSAVGEIVYRYRYTKQGHWVELNSNEYNIINDRTSSENSNNLNKKVSHRNRPALNTKKSKNGIEIDVESGTEDYKSRNKNKKKICSNKFGWQQCHCKKNYDS